LSADDDGAVVVGEVVRIAEQDQVHRSGWRIAVLINLAALLPMITVISVVTRTTRLINKAAFVREVPDHRWSDSRPQGRIEQPGGLRSTKPDGAAPV
jgi:hypothetical protein